MDVIDATIGDQSFGSLSTIPLEHMVICVDSDQNFLKSMEFFLPEKVNEKEDGRVRYRFLFFDNPLRALDRLKEITEEGETVALVLSDQKMPHMKGTEFFSRVKHISPQSIRVLLTGYGGLESAILAMNENLLDKYLTKPIENEHDFVLNIRHLLQRFRMQKTISAQDKIIREFYEFSNVLNGIEDFQQTLDYIVSRIEKMLKCRRISIMLYEDGKLRIKASKGIPEEIVNSTSIPIGERISGTVFGRKKAILAKTVHEIPYIDDTIDIDAQSFISIPLLLAGLTSLDQPLGVINVTQKHNNVSFTDSDLETLTYIANTAALAIHNMINRKRLERAYVETKTQAASLKYQAMHDDLTGLPNRTMLKDKIQEAIKTAQADKTPFALLLMDLNRFKEINDTLGHHSGDILLQQIAEKLNNVLKKSDLLSRLGGDEFAILLERTGAGEATQVVKKILEILKQPFTLEGLSLEISTSIGLSLYPDHGDDVSLLLRRADVAMYTAKSKGQGYCMYNSRDDKYDHRRLAMLSELRRAIDTDQLLLHYQPKINLKTNCITSVEAFIRWIHPYYGFMPPDQFIPLAEQTELINPLTRWVLENALRQCSTWQAEGINLAMSVNLSARNLQDEQFADLVAELLAKWKIKPNVLTLEITESTAMANLERSLVVLNCLNSMGVLLSIDDFGTGHSSLAYIKQLPVKELKIDKSFIMSMETNANDALIVSAAIDLGHNLGLSVVAEGIETKGTYGHLAKLGCNQGQGYFISRPLPAHELKIWLFQSPWGLKSSTCASARIMEEINFSLADNLV
ncbi:MAG: EAL domain-containing protein [bacterium]